jgi:alkanesulfonate monooxygenase SsuD/methylene tetrahydromethanopterin reductase-like flavin-dependent oxidoreductase (luciferase family)
MSAAPADVSFGVSLSNRAVVIGEVRALDNVELAVTAERSGLFDSAWVGDSIVAKPRLETIAALSAMASRTTRIKLGVACLATFPLRHPVVFAHQWASLDALSEGRSLLAVCLGGHGPRQLVEAEFAALGASLAERVPRMLEGIEILRRLWSEDDVTHRGRFYQFEHVTIGPKPSQQPCPIWIANNPTDPAVMERAYRRVARHADGWMTGSLSPSLFAERWEWIRALRREERGHDAGFPSSNHLRANVNRDREAAFDEAKQFLDAYYSVDHTRRHLEQDCVIGTPDECVEKLVAYARAGCDVIIIRLCSWNPRQQLERWIADVIPAVRRQLQAGSESSG